MIGWLQKVTTTKYRGTTEVKKLSYLVRNKVYSQGVTRLYIAEGNYVPEHLLGKTQVETSYKEGYDVSHVWQWEPKDE